MTSQQRKQEQPTLSLFGCPRSSAFKQLLEYLRVTLASAKDEFRAQEQDPLPIPQVLSLMQSSFGLLLCEAQLILWEEVQLLLQLDLQRSVLLCSEVFWQKWRVLLLTQLNQSFWCDQRLLTFIYDALCSYLFNI